MPNRDAAATSSNVDVIGLGENSVDRVLIVPQLPGTAMKLRVSAPTRSCGGQVATSMAACAALGLRAAYVGSVGDDGDGRLVRDTLIASGVDVAHLTTIHGATTRWATILIDQSTGERVVLWDRDAALSLTEDQVSAVDVTMARVVHVDDTDIAASIRLALAARRAGRLVTTDIDSSSDPRDAMALLKLATHPIVSEHALAILSGERDAERGLRALRSRCDGVLCVTLGRHGAMALDGETLVMADGFSVTAVDTTGAGDVFRAGFIAALLAERDLAYVLRFANAAAALSCTKPGAIGGVPTLEDVRALLDTSDR